MYDGSDLIRDRPFPPIFKIGMRVKSYWQDSWTCRKCGVVVDAAFTGQGQMCEVEFDYGLGNEAVPAKWLVEEDQSG